MATRSRSSRTKTEDIQGTLREIDLQDEKLRYVKQPNGDVFLSIEDFYKANYIGVPNIGNHFKDWSPDNGDLKLNVRYLVNPANKIQATIPCVRLDGLVSFVNHAAGKLRGAMLRHDELEFPEAEDFSEIPARKRGRSVWAGSSSESESEEEAKSESEFEEDEIEFDEDEGKEYDADEDMRKKIKLMPQPEKDRLRAELIEVLGPDKYEVIPESERLPPAAFSVGMRLEHLGFDAEHPDKMKIASRVLARVRREVGEPKTVNRGYGLLRYYIAPEELDVMDEVIREFA